MKNEHLSALLEAAGAENDGEYRVLPGERTLTLHIEKGGVGLNVAKVSRLRVQGELLFAQNAREELTVLYVADVFAIAMDGEAKTTRKAGFR
ncbi:MAG TPA: hypothetical protein VLC09_00595 [Polyangiaceae bacterium]|nr:hypothetical protein [Polyangiaceae bacterium]